MVGRAVRKPRTAVAVILVAALIIGAIAPVALASSHREAPQIANNPAADNTDLYAFRSPDRPDSVTIIANFVPFENPANGPLFYKFSDNVLYKITVFNNKGDTIVYQFAFKTTVRDNDTFRYNREDGVIDSLTDKAFNVRQTYTVTRFMNGQKTVLGQDLPTPPVNIGPKSTPNYESLASQAVSSLDDNIKSFAGQRDDPYFADDGAFYDLLNSPISPPGGGGAGVDSYAGLNVQTIAIQVPITQLIRSKNGIIPTNPSDPNAVIAVYASAEPQKGAAPVSLEKSEKAEDRKASRLNEWLSKLLSSSFISTLARPIFGRPATTTTTTIPSGQAPTSPNQISRVGHPLINALMIPIKDKDKWNASNPLNDGQFNNFYQNPLPADYLKTFLGIDVPANPRSDLTKILLEGFSLNQVGVNFSNKGGPNRQADLLRLNVAVPPRRAGEPGFNRLGLFRGDLAGYPNGRRLEDDVMDISMQIYAGATPFSSALNAFPNNSLGDGVDANDVPFLSSFPYVGTPHPGFGAP